MNKSAKDNQSMSREYWTALIDGMPDSYICSETGAIFKSYDDYLRVKRLVGDQ